MGKCRSKSGKSNAKKHSLRRSVRNTCEQKEAAISAEAAERIERIERERAKRTRAKEATVSAAASSKADTKRKQPMYSDDSDLSDWGIEERNPNRTYSGVATCITCYQLHTCLTEQLLLIQRREETWSGRRPDKIRSETKLSVRLRRKETMNLKAVPIATNLVPIRVEERFEIDDIRVRDKPHDLQFTVLSIIWKLKTSREQCRRNTGD